MQDTGYDDDDDSNVPAKKDVQEEEGTPIYDFNEKKVQEDEHESNF